MPTKTVLRKRKTTRTSVLTTSESYFHDESGNLLKPIDKFTAEEVRDYYQVCLLPDFEQWGINSDNGELLEKLFKRAVELLFIL